MAENNKKAKKIKKAPGDFFKPNGAVMTFEEFIKAPSLPTTSRKGSNKWAQILEYLVDLVKPKGFMAVLNLREVFPELTKKGLINWRTTKEGKKVLPYSMTSTGLIAYSKYKGKDLNHPIANAIIRYNAKHAEKITAGLIKGYLVIANKNAYQKVRELARTQKGFWKQILEQMAQFKVF